MKLGLVLAGGGVAGIAWETGFLLGLQDKSPDTAAALLTADVLIGTSAGSTVSAQIASGVTLQELFDAQTAEATGGELDPKVDVEVLGQMFVDAIAGSQDRAEQLRLLGEAAMRADTVEPAVRRAVIERGCPIGCGPTGSCASRRSTHRPVS